MKQKTGSLDILNRIDKALARIIRNRGGRDEGQESMIVKRQIIHMKMK